MSLRLFELQLLAVHDTEDESGPTSLLRDGARFRIPNTTPAANNATTVDMATARRLKAMP
jgi:hypothetical protein